MPDNVVNKAIVCPMCGELGKAEIYTSVNPTVNKSLRNKVLDGELFSWRCPSCNYSARLNYPILYNDMKNRFMVYLIPKIDRYQLCDKELEEKYSNLRNISKRITADFNSFKEKIFINCLIKDTTDIKMEIAPAGTGVYSGLYLLIEDENLNIQNVKNVLYNEGFLQYLRFLGKFKSGGYMTFSSIELENYINYEIDEKIWSKISV